MELQEGDEGDCELLKTSETMFKEEEVDFSIKSLKQDKAPDIDLVDVRMMRSVNKILKGLLLRLFNSCVSLSRFPKNGRRQEYFSFLRRGRFQSYRHHIVQYICCLFLEKP